ncbi:DJ-1/PfpI family protein [Klebsiella quasipneumoniae]|uniref:DJ-1/PfpI family protein n=1 Tax=Klebsiella quasipneumoniae TaxID=1463165 RepID=UPI003D722D67
MVPGWRGIDAPVPEALCAALAAAHARGCRIISICSGVFVLAAAGLLNGRQATTHWRYTAALPAEVISKSSPTYRTSSTTWICGKRDCSAAV